MKDKHNAILILVSSNNSIPYYGGSSNSSFHLFIFLLSGVCLWYQFSVSIVSSFFFSRVPSSHNYITTEIHLNHYKVSPCIFYFSFFSIDHPFVTGVLHGGSTWWFIKDLIPSRSVHWDSFQGSSSILHLAIRSAICSILSFEVVLCHCW